MANWRVYMVGYGRGGAVYSNIFKTCSSLDDAKNTLANYYNKYVELCRRYFAWRLDEEAEVMTDEQVLMRFYEEFSYDGMTIHTKLHGYNQDWRIVFE